MARLVFQINVHASINHLEFIDHIFYRARSHRLPVHRPHSSLDRILTGARLLRHPKNHSASSGVNLNGKPDLL